MGTSKSCCAPKQLRYPDLSGDRTQPFPGFSGFPESRGDGVSVVSLSAKRVYQQKWVCRVAGLHPCVTDMPLLQSWKYGDADLPQGLHPALPTCHPYGI